MSVFEAISIQGIRSFDPQNPQVLNFFKPVTLILGQNGTGKTTIIECLKYSTTGDLPPGSKVGGSFVHDPKIAGETEVKAKVSLQIKNLRGETMTVSRALKATQKNKQVSMTTLDSSIKRYSDKGEISISSKCADIDLEMTNSLGVSKAVLENVIFCHQEDSNWPLIEGKAVKERFDDLFASSRYVKALDNIRKIKIEKETNVKSYKSELEYLQRDVDVNNKKSSEKRELETEESVLSDKIMISQEKIEPIDLSIQKCRSQYQELCEIDKKRDILENEKRSFLDRIQELENNIMDKNDYSAVELEKMINDSDIHLMNLKGSMDEEDGKLNVLSGEISKWQKENQAFTQSKNALQSKIAINDSLQKELNSDLLTIVEEVQLPYDENNSFLMIKNLESYVRELESIRDKDLQMADDKLRISQTELDSKQSEKTKLEHEIEINKKNLKIKKNELMNLERKITDLGEDSAKLCTIKEKLTLLNNESVSLKKLFDSISIKKDIENKSENLSKLEDQRNKIDIQVKNFQNEDIIHNEIVSLKQQKLEKMSIIKRLRNRHNDALETLLDNNVPSTNLKRQLDQQLYKLHQKSDETQASQIILQSELAKLKVEFKQIKDQISGNKQLIDKFEEDVIVICGHNPLDISLSNFREIKKKLEEEALSIQSNVSLYSKFHQILLKNKSDCPLCHREFNHQSEVNDLIEELNDKCSNVPAKLDSLSSEIKNINEKIESLIKLESQSENIINLRESIANTLANILQLKIIKISEFENTVNKLANEKEGYTNKEKLASSILGDVANMEKYNDEIENFNIKILALEQQITLPLDEFKQKYESIQNDRNDSQNLLLNLKKELDILRKFYDDSLSKENNLTKQIHNLENERLKIQDSLQESSNFHFQKESYQTNIDDLEKQIHLSISYLSPVSDNLKIMKDNFNKLMQSKNSSESKAKENIDRLKFRIGEIMLKINKVNKSKLENLNEQLETVDNKISNLLSKIRQNIVGQENCKTIIEEFKSKIRNHQIKLREYRDTLQIRHHMTEIAKIDESLEKLEDKFTGFDLSNIEIELNRLENHHKTLKQEIDRFMTQKTQILTKIDMVVKDLSTDQYMNADTRYLDMMYKLKISELVISDLEKYYKAMDNAIMSYHHAKMAEINKILKELWRNTYSGNDIDYLEICSDEDNSASGSKKRNYNYRVVMVKSNHGARLDMRGRCSAGQKVLACLLIRLALAEVFCLHCGVLALDEPTTNLDQENIESLAYALVEIIKTRSKQKNFQLIVITHDEDFVKLLGRSEYIDEFYKIHANSNGHSEIEKSGLDRRL